MSTAKTTSFTPDLDSTSDCSSHSLRISPALSNPHDPPRYNEEEPDLQTRIQQLKADAQDGNDSPLPILSYPYPEKMSWMRHDLSSSEKARTNIVSTYFSAISTKKDEIIAALIENGLVTPETTDQDGRTPLLVAIEEGHIRTVQQLMDFDANVNAFGSVSRLPYYERNGEKIMRTPLQLAASKGNLTIVKLLMETYGADDGLVAPDGEIALRLAASGGHKDVVEYLPSRRSGGWKRWKNKHRKAMRRCKKAAKGIVWFFRILLWEVPKFFFWTVPKEAVVRPIVKKAKWLHEHRKELPRMLVEWLGRVWEGIKRTPKRLARFGKEVFDFGKEFGKELGKLVWRVIRKSPKAAKIVVLWLWSGIKKIGRAIADIFGRLFSFLHTVAVAITTFFRELTLQNVIDGFGAFLRAIFVNGPKQIWKWLCKFEEMTLKIFKNLFGCVGELLWLLIRGIVELFIYVPKKIGVMVAAIFGSMASGCKEVAIWVNPKRH